MPRTNLKNVELQKRDLALLMDLRNLSLLSLDQIWRLHWPTASREVCRKRLSALVNHGENWLEKMSISAPEMAEVGLEPAKVYTLSSSGRSWFRAQERPTGKIARRRQALHDLLVSETYVRLVEISRKSGIDVDWRPDWATRFYRKSADERPTLVPDGLAVLTKAMPEGRPQQFTFFLELDLSREAHGRPSSRFGRKFRGYDQFLKNWSSHEALADLLWFPPVLIITHGERRLENLAAAALKHRRGRVAVAYGLTTLATLQRDVDFLYAKNWHLIPSDSKTIAKNVQLLDMDWQTSVQRNARPAPARKTSPAKAATPAPASQSPPAKPAEPAPALQSPPPAKPATPPHARQSPQWPAYKLPLVWADLPHGPELTEARRAAGLPWLPATSPLQRPTRKPATLQEFMQFHHQRHRRQWLLTITDPARQQARQAQLKAAAAAQKTRQPASLWQRMRGIFTSN